eukprot:scaffold157096_cov57-Cyclotella_meneghiniana.AAC.1
MKKRGLLIAPFVRSRRMKSSNDKTFKPPPRIGKVGQLRTLVERLKSNPDSPVTDKEDSWLWRMYECLNDPWVLSAVVERSVAETAPAPEEPSVLDRTHIVVSPLDTPRESSMSFAIIGDEDLLRETCQRVISSMIDETNTSLVRERVTALYPKIIKRFNQFKQHNIPPPRQICTTIEDSLLRPKGVAVYYSHDDDHCKDFQGVALYHDSQRARFISAVHVDGKEKSFLKQYENDLSNSKDPTTELSRAYPYKKPCNPGGWRGMFRELD